MDVFERIMNRRRCVKTMLTLGAGLLAGVKPVYGAEPAPRARVAVVRTGDRVKGVEQALAEFDLTGFKEKSVALKANYNSADPFPASTHPDTLLTLSRALKSAGAGSMTLVERSGMGETDSVLRKMGAYRVAETAGFDVVVMDDLDKNGFVRETPPGTHWKKGFLLERHFAEADKVVQTCCLKTHQFGGHFTMSLKNVVGAIAKHDPESGYNYMSELHSSPLQRTLIAEISQAFRNDLIVMDGMSAFVDGGPHRGTEVSTNVIIAGTDPVAVDAVGVAILRMYGTTHEVATGRVFEQEQLRRAAELGLGASRARDIDLVPVGQDAENFVKRIRKELDA
ncbi:DUF362 domain-containing protein [Pseudodesulfovibrio thermohalotolerans]|uniref:DUF362 domain-containing protein n=1 Tax=Pseudodesulfovibrio thermohalotolerans TaxID=2880651 RepID=UPI002443666C|nr:DUF362 domain-containing protein [Pseudodesulfovibrio thermohalotolerans]WFS62955.1 DUF362 domain-containing protein [Pseudodesulfovibrio thermohalotolerans]